MKRQNKLINIFYLPALLLFAVFVVYPLINGIRISFTNWDGFHANYSYVGLQNFERLLTDKTFWTSVKNTLIYGFGSTLFQNILGLAFAVFLNSKFRGRSAVRTIIYLPVMVAPLIMGYMMYFLFNYRGALNDVMTLFHLETVDWLANSSTAVGIMTGINTLQFAGISMVIYLAGLQNIPTTYYEAASIDGVGKWGQFRYISLPLLRPAIVSSIMINIIGGLKLFDIILALVGRSPTGAQSLSVYSPYMYFNKENAGYAAAIGLTSFLLIMIVSAVMMAFLDRKGDDLT
ncbi:MAG: sugar ABC transporter permease [Firmicutes bacterium]|nr:sugar ABC transporter permease [Bacillota bacterium]